jgi:hypothetical protein
MKRKRLVAVGLVAVSLVVCSACWAAGPSPRRTPDGLHQS